MNHAFGKKRCLTQGRQGDGLVSLRLCDFARGILWSHAKALRRKDWVWRLCAWRSHPFGICAMPSLESRKNFWEYVCEKGKDYVSLAGEEGGPSTLPPKNGGIAQGEQTFFILHLVPNVSSRSDPFGIGNGALGSSASSLKCSQTTCPAAAGRSECRRHLPKGSLRDLRENPRHYSIVNQRSYSVMDSSRS